MQNEMALPLVAQTLDYTCGAACFESMFRYLGGQSLGEMHFAHLLGTFELGYTAPDKVAQLANVFGFKVVLKRETLFHELIKSFREGNVIFVTWWYEDSGHYSLVKGISDTHITLMDPWLAREYKNNILTVLEFQEFWKMRGAVMISVSG